MITLFAWGWLSYLTMEKKIHADTDLILRDYSNDIIKRKLSGQPLPERFNGAYNTYSLVPVDAEYVETNPAVLYEDAEAYIISQEDFASSRIRKQIFVDAEGNHFELTVSIPTFEQDTLINHVMWWTVILFFVLLVSVLIIGMSVFNYNMRPLTRLLDWMDSYTPGTHPGDIPLKTDVLEFRKLAEASMKAVNRFEKQYEERRLFIGNVSHELQTPLAVCSNRLEVILNNEGLQEEVAESLVKLHRSLQHIIRLNKTMLLITKIENGQFPETEPVDFYVLIKDALELQDEIYAHKSIDSRLTAASACVSTMNPQMASVLVNNLVKNAYSHSPKHSSVEVHASSEGFCISNAGDNGLDSSRIFTRFYLPDGRKEGSTGLGLNLVYSVCKSNGMEVTYDFREKRHVFCVNFKKSK